MIGSHFVSKNVFWDNAVGYLRNGEYRAIGPLKDLLVGTFWSSRNDSKPVSKQKCVFRKCCGVSQKWWSISEMVLELSNLCHCVQHPRKLTSRDFWSSRNDSKPVSKQKCVFRKCCGVSQKWCMLELSNLCHCVQHPWKVTLEKTF